MKLTTKQKWLRTIRWLNRNFPTRYPTYVQSKKMKDDGEAELDDMYFMIYVRKDASLTIKIDSLLHEWAHILTWFGAETHEDHSSEWGLAYGRIYRLFLEWDFGRKKE